MIRRILTLGPTGHSTESPLSGRPQFVSRQLGFSLVEVMMSVVLMGIGLALALPSYRDMVEKRQITNGAEQLASFINTAQGVAMKTNQVNQELHVVTGAFGYSGRYLTARLLADGHRVRTLTNSPRRANPFGNQVEARPFDFDQPAKLIESLRGAAVLYNTYWVRFNHGDFSHAAAVENTLKLFAAAKAAGVGPVVHVSITNPSEDSPLPYFAGKARLERALRESGIPHSILRPAVLFGKEDILINNIAWCLRRFPFFAVFGDGQYRLQPIYVDDLAKLAVEQGRTAGNQLVDAIGPETFTYRELVRQIGEIIGQRRAIVSSPPSLGWAAGWLMGKFTGDVVITRKEISGLMQDLLCTASPPAGQTRLTDWARQHAATLGPRWYRTIPQWTCIWPRGFLLSTRTAPSPTLTIRVCWTRQ